MVIAVQQHTTAHPHQSSPKPAVENGRNVPARTRNRPNVAQARKFHLSLASTMRKEIA